MGRERRVQTCYMDTVCFIKQRIPVYKCSESRFYEMGDISVKRDFFLIDVLLQRPAATSLGSSNTSAQSKDSLRLICYLSHIFFPFFPSYLLASFILLSLIYFLCINDMSFFFLICPPCFTITNLTKPIS